MNNEVYQQTTSINGSGCFTANRDSTIYIANVLLPVSTSQNFYLADSQSSIIVQAISTPQVFNVYGFGNGNMVGVTLPLLGNILNPAYSYNPSTGILRLKSLVYQDFNIGPGYNPSLFLIVTDNGAGLPQQYSVRFLIVALFHQELYPHLVRLLVNPCLPRQELIQPSTRPQ